MMIRRAVFTVGLVLAILCTPLRGEAQPAANVPRIGVLASGRALDAQTTRAPQGGGAQSVPRRASFERAQPDSRRLSARHAGRRESAARDASSGRRGER